MELLELEGPSSVVGPASVVGPTSVVGPASVVGPTSVVGPASVVGPTSVVGPAAVAVEPAVEEVLGGFFGSGGLKLPCQAASTKGYSGGVVGTASPKITTRVPGAASGASGASVGSWSLLFPLHFPQSSSVSAEGSERVSAGTATGIGSSFLAFLKDSN